MAKTHAQIREEGKQVRFMFNEVCKAVLPYLLRDYSSESETLTTKILTRFVYVKVGIDNLYEEYSARPSAGRETFRDTVTQVQLEQIRLQELEISRRLIKLPFTLSEKINRPTDLLNYLAQ